MKTINVISSIALVLSCSALLASPVAHNHGTRSHSHNLPATGMAHKHGSLPTASLSKNKIVKNNVSHSQGNKAKTSSKIINYYYGLIAGLPTSRERVAMIDSVSQLQGTRIVGGLIDKYKNKGGIVGINRHKAQSKNEIKAACNDYARQLQNRVDEDKTKKMELYKFSSERCVLKAFKMLRFSGATSTNYSHSTPANTVQDGVKNKLEERINTIKKQKTNEFKNKLESKLKDVFNLF